MLQVIQLVLLGTRIYWGSRGWIYWGSGATGAQGSTGHGVYWGTRAQGNTGAQGLLGHKEQLGLRALLGHKDLQGSRGSRRYRAQGATGAQGYWRPRGSGSTGAGALLEHRALLGQGALVLGNLGKEPLGTRSTGSCGAQGTTGAQASGAQCTGVQGATGFQGHQGKMELWRCILTINLAIILFNQIQVKTI